LIGEHPFRIGDYVAVQGMEGLVESVGFRSTRLRTFEDSLLTIPNSVMAAALIDNRGVRTAAASARSSRWPTAPRWTVWSRFRDALRAFATGHPRVLPDKVEVHIVDLGASSVDLLVQVYFRVATYTEEMSCRDEFSREILRQAERLGVEIAFPTHTVHLAGSGAAGHEVPPPPKLLGRGPRRGAAARPSARADLAPGS
jgi:MscS family membrane protein